MNSTASLAVVFRNRILDSLLQFHLILDFSFGGPALFGQKVAASSATASQGTVFGAQATPSKNVGFGDLSKPSDGKQEEKQSSGEIG